MEQIETPWMRLCDLYDRFVKTIDPNTHQSTVEFKKGYLPFKRAQIYKLIAKGEMPCYPGVMKRGYIFNRDEIDDWLKKFKVKPLSEYLKTAS